ncbi:MAG: nuclear transport factor 2 family protein [Sphingomonas sp.]|uniref:nuclear transport factor 2 family protein n=1 Tax=Sphingomonas sp. TaxID=28214 RepID=UPI001ACBAA9A|nr:nuclear transport factor 2 family protein [Sphingomonas sp.]MBN8816790.1 nuclear transport factor 2 family protein [Sphingomonas sp.]
MMRPLFAAMLALPLLGNADPDLAGIRGVIDTFRVAIIAKDKAALERLPATDTISFIASIDPPTLARLRQRRPDAKRIFPSSYAEFVKGVVTDPTRQEEKFSNIRIHSDWAVATVWFDYSFLENGKVSNWGHESWGLVRTDDGWRISSIIYSIALPAPAKQ